MPEIPIEIINLNAKAGFNEDIINGNLEGSIKAGISISADLCHGINLGIDASIAANVLGNLDFLFLGAQAKGELSAAAGIRAKARIEPNLLERLGLSIYVGAYARAMASGSLSVYLTTEYISQKVQDNLDSFSSDLFLIFAEELKAEIGVWGRVAFAAMAEANLNVLMDVSRLKSGFEISGGYKLGLEAGTGYDFYCNVGFKNLRRAVNRSSIRISQEIKKEILQTNLPQKALLAEALDFAFPFVVLLSFDLGNKSVERGEFLQKEEVAQLVFDNFMANLQRYAIDRIFDSAVKWLTDEFANLYQQVLQIQLDNEARTSLNESVDALIDILEKGDFRLSDISGIISHFITIVDVLDNGFLDGFKKPLSLLWISSVLGLEIRQMLSSLSAEISGGSTFVGEASTSVTQSVFPTTSELIKDEVRAVLDIEFIEIDTSIAIDYLIEVGIEATEEWIFPEIIEFIELFESNFSGLTFGGLIEDLLRGLRGEGNLASYNSYVALKKMVKDELIDDLLMKQLLPAIETELNNPILTRYMQEVLKPSLYLGSDFIFAKLDKFLIDDLRGVSNLPAFVSGISAGSGAVVYQVVARNIAFFDEIVTDFMLDNVYLGFQQLGTQFNNPNDPFFLNCKTLLNQTFPDISNIDDNADAVQQLLFDLALAFREITGPTIFTAERRINLRNLKRDVLLSMSGDIDYNGSTDPFIDRLIDCQHIPNQDLAIALGRLLFEISLDGFLVFWEKIVPAMGDFFLALSFNILTELRTDLITFIELLRTNAENALRAFNEFNQHFNEEVIELLQVIDLEITRFQNRFNIHLTEWGETAKARIHYQRIEIINNIPNSTLRTASLVTFTTLTWPVESIILDIAIVAATITLRTGLDALVTGIDTLTNIGDSVILLKQKVEQAIIVGLKDFVLQPILDTALFMVNVILPQEFLDAIEEFLSYRQEQKHLESERLEKQEALAELDLEKVRKMEAYSRNNFNPLVDLKLVEPQKDFMFIYPKEVLLQLLLKNGNHNMISDPSSKRIQAQLNGQNIELTVNNWSSTSGGMVYTEYMEEVKHGLNILELSFIKGVLQDEIIRQKVAFAVDENAPYKHANFDLSILVNPPGDDTISEHVLIIYKGESDMKAEDWLLQDKAGHKYYLPKLTLKPNDSLSIYTGGNPAIDKYDKRRKNKILHMGRRKAVWNNEGDTLYLSDAKNVLIYSHTYTT